MDNVLMVDYLTIDDDVDYIELIDDPDKDVWTLINEQKPELYDSIDDILNVTCFK